MTRGWYIWAVSHDPVKVPSVEYAAVESYCHRGTPPECGSALYYLRMYIISKLESQKISKACAVFGIDIHKLDIQVRSRKSPVDAFNEFARQLLDNITH